MIFSLDTMLTFGREYCSVDHRTNSTGVPVIFALTAIKKKQEFEVKETFKIDSVSELSKKLSRDQHCFLTLSGNQVLVRSTSTSGTDIKIIRTAFPNIDINEFYYQILKTTTENIVALCRKEHIKQIFKSYKKNGIHLIGFSLSFFSIQHLFELIKDEEIQISNYLIRKKQENIVSFEKSDQEDEKMYHIAGTSINSPFLLPLGSLFNYELNFPNSASNFEDRNIELRKEFKQIVFFRKGLATGVGIILLSLLINFFLFSTFYSELQELKAQHQTELTQKEAFEKKHSRIVEKEKTVTNIFNNSNSKSTFYLNSLINTTPGSLLLTELNYQPLKKQVKENEFIILEKRTIRIAGESNNENELSQWIKELEETTWIEEVKVSDFSYNTVSRSNFALTLKLPKDETVE